ncbi:MAG: two-component regulator propeller domain-containing protein [Arcticibacter sp.]
MMLKPQTEWLKSCIKLSIILFSACSYLQSYSATLNFRHYSVREGLANSTVYDVFQDSKDFIWIATESGVNRFDGNKFELFTMDNGLSDNEVLQIREDSSGRIWFLTLNGKPSYFLGGKFFNTSTDPLLKKFMGHGSLTAFFEDSSKRLWFSTNQNKIIQISPKKKVDVYSSPENSFVNATVLENDTKEILVFSEGSVFKLNNKQFTRIRLRHNPLSPKSIYYDRSNRSIFFPGQQGLIRLHDNQTTKVVNLPERLPATASSFVYNKKQMWIGTMGQGVLLCNLESQRSEYHLEGLSISHILTDRQGNIWISTLGDGVYLLPYYTGFVRHLTRSDGLSGDAITALAKSAKGSMLGYADGAIDIFDQKSIKNVVARPAAGQSPVKKIFFDKTSGTLWYGTDSKLSGRSRNTTETNFLNDPKWSSYALKSFSLDKENNVAVALASGVYILNVDRSAKRDSHIDLSTARHFPNRAFAVHYDRNGGLWFSNIEGLHQYKDGRLLEPYKQYPKLRHRITDIITLPDNTTICSSYGFGVFVLKDAKLIQTITIEDGLQSNICKKLFAEGNNVWVVTGKGVSKIHFNRDKPKITNYSTANGLLSNEINDIYVDQDTAYIASNSGLTIFREPGQSANTTIPPVTIRSIFVNNHPSDMRQVRHLSHEENNVSVTFVCMDFTHPDQVVYSYRTSHDEEWIETKEQTIEFSSLKPGHYELEVRAKSMYTDWTQPTSIRLNIHEPFWMRWWFIVITSGLSIFALFMFVRHYYRIKQVREEEKLLTKTRIISLEQQALQAMMNPHFIFNVMNSIQYFINTRDNAMANQVLTGFARLIRKNLDICNKSYISVEEEITYLNLYLSLEKLRFGDRLSYSIVANADVDLTSTYIPSMLLQPYVENAIWHGIMPMSEPGEILIEITTADNALVITIRDNGIGIDESMRSRSSDHISRGMQLTQQRVDLLNRFNKDCISISALQQETGGTIVAVKVPLKPFTQSN